MAGYTSETLKWKFRSSDQKYHYVYSEMKKLEKLDDISVIYSPFSLGDYTNLIPCYWSHARNICFEETQCCHVFKVSSNKAGLWGSFGTVSIICSTITRWSKKHFSPFYHHLKSSCEICSFLSTSNPLKLLQEFDQLGPVTFEKSSRAVQFYYFILPKWCGEPTGSLSAWLEDCSPYAFFCHFLLIHLFGLFIGRN